MTLIGGRRRPSGLDLLVKVLDRISEIHLITSWGVVPPRSALSHNSTRSAPDSIAVMAESRLKHAISKSAIDMYRGRHVVIDKNYYIIYLVSWHLRLIVSERLPLMLLFRCEKGLNRESQARSQSARAIIQNNLIDSGGSPNRQLPLYVVISSRCLLRRLPRPRLPSTPIDYAPLSRLTTRESINTPAMMMVRNQVGIDSPRNTPLQLTHDLHRLRSNICPFRVQKYMSRTSKLSF